MLGYCKRGHVPSDNNAHISVSDTNRALCCCCTDLNRANAIQKRMVTRKISKDGSGGTYFFRKKNHRLSFESVQNETFGSSPVKLGNPLTFSLITNRKISRLLRKYSPVGAFEDYISMSFL